MKMPFLGFLLTSVLSGTALADNQQYTCHDVGQKKLCSFLEETVYPYEPNILEAIVLHSNANLMRIKSECGKYGMILDQKTRNGATGGIGNFEWHHKDNNGSIFVSTKGRFQCILADS